MTDTAPDQTLRSTPFNTAFMLVLFGSALLMFGGFSMVGLFNLAPAVRIGDRSALLLAAALFLGGPWGCGFLTAYIVSAALFYVRLDGDGVTYRTGFGRRTVSGGAITGITFLDSLKGWRYIVIRSTGGADTLTNMVWSDKAFDGLTERIRVWSQSGGRSIPITEGDTYSYQTAREFWFGKGNLPHYYQSKIPIAAAGYVAAFGAASIVGLFHPVAPQLRRPYPQQAQPANTPGSARMQCTVTASGMLEHCIVLSENPPGYGFGQAALKTAHLFKMRTRTQDGKPVAGATVIVPVQFRAPAERASATPARP